MNTSGGGVGSRLRVAVVGVLALGVLAGCGAASTTRPTSAPTDPSPSATGSATPGDPSTDPSSDASNDPAVPAGVVMKAPGRLTTPAVSPDILLYGRSTLSSSVVDRVRHLPGVVAADQFAMAQFFSEDTTVTYAAVNPATFRRFTPSGTADYTPVWDRVADGEMAISRKLARGMASSTGYVRMGNGAASPRVHVGAYADLTPSLAARTFVNAVVNEKWAPSLHMVPGNALVLSTGNTAPEGVARQVQRLVGKHTAVSILSHTYDIHAVQTAVVTGTPVAAAIGTYNYTANSNGTINPDPRWVAANIRTEQVPLLGTVTCNKIMLPELRAALSEVQAAGLAAKVYHYDGCFVPRFINHNPADGVSNHSFGTAIDINAAQNQRGGRGQMDIRVVRIFEKWGFTWGGSWRYTDPMHFELSRIVRVG